MSSLNKKKFGETEIIMIQETTVEELKALFGVNIVMGLYPLPQYKLYWHPNDFIGN